MVDYHLKVEEGVTKEKLNGMYDGSNDFLRLQMLEYHIQGSQC